MSTIKMPPSKKIKKSSVAIPNGRRRGPIGKAKILSKDQYLSALTVAQETSMFALRDELFVILSHVCGMRAQEIARLHVEDITDAEGKFISKLTVSKRGAKYGKERTLPIPIELRNRLAQYAKLAEIIEGPLFWTQRGDPCTSNVVQKQIKAVFKRSGFTGARSHSGRRFAITKFARSMHEFDASIRDVQNFAGHSHMNTTAAYIDLSKSADRFSKSAWIE